MQENNRGKKNPTSKKTPGNQTKPKQNPETTNLLPQGNTFMLNVFLHKINAIPLCASMI